MTDNIEPFFHVLIIHSYIFLREMSTQVLCSILIGLFVFLLWRHRGSFYILEESSLLDTWLANTSPQTGVVFSTFLMVSCEAQTVLILLKSNAPAFWWFVCSIGVLPMKPGHEDLLLFFLLRVLHLNFILCYAALQLSQYHLLKRLSFPYWMMLAPL